MRIYRTTSGFTLLELMIGMTIFAVMSVAIISVYIQATYLSQKMRALRHLSESAREITERITEDVRTRGIGSGSALDRDYPLWTGYMYSGSGSEYMNINGGIVYVYGRKTSTGIVPCTSSGGNVQNPEEKVHCGIYRVIGDNYPDAWNLVDSFIPEEERKRVRVENCRFYISGDGISTEKKVTLVFTLSLMPRIGVPPHLISDTRMKIQTTISERFFKSSP